MDYRKIELAKEAFGQMYQLAQDYRQQAQLATQRAEELERKVEQLSRNMPVLEDLGRKEDTSLDYLKVIANNLGELQQKAERYGENQNTLNRDTVIPEIRKEIDELFSQLSMNIHEEINGLQNMIEQNGQKEGNEISGQSGSEKEELEEKATEKEEKSPFEGIDSKFE